MFRRIKDSVILERKNDEAIYAAALAEYQSGRIRPGLMAKAMAECSGDEPKAKSAYLRLLAEAIRDDIYIASRAAEHAEREARRHAFEAWRVQQEEARAAKVPRIEKQTHKATKKGSADLIGIAAVLLALLLWALIKSADSSTAPSTPPPSTLTTTPSPTEVRASLSERTYTPQRTSTSSVQSQPAGQGPRPSAQPQPAGQGNRPCVYKSVMSDEDYHACGLTPPRSP